VRACFRDTAPAADRCGRRLQNPPPRPTGVFRIVPPNNPQGFTRPDKKRKNGGPRIDGPPYKRPQASPRLPARKSIRICWNIRHRGRESPPDRKSRQGVAAAVRVIPSRSADYESERASVGQTSMQAPQSPHVESSTLATSSCTAMASNGHDDAHSPHPEHFSASTIAVMEPNSPWKRPKKPQTPHGPIGRRCTHSLQPTNLRRDRQPAKWPPARHSATGRST
jgi:hypothetical protein